MKQLKFMLAAATAVGIAAAAQAALVTNTVGFVNENFNNYEAMGVPNELVPGFFYNGDDQDNESKIDCKVAGDDSDMALFVNTSTNPVLRTIQANGSAYDFTDNANAGHSLYIDTMVRFTVTPAGDVVEPAPTDKLMIYLQEFVDTTTDGEGDDVVTTKTYTTNLVVKAAKYTAATSGFGTSKPASYDKTVAPVKVNYVVEPEVWYNLKVVASKLNADGAVAFKVMIKNPLKKDADFTVLENGGDLYTEDNTLFPSLMGVTGDSFKTVQYVGFAGEGIVDDIVTAEVFEGPSSVGFTLALGDGVSAVQWTINGTEKNDGDTFSATAGTELDVVINSVTYLPGYAGTQNWIGWTTNTIESATVTVEAEQFGTVVNGVVTPNETVAARVTNGSFAYGDATGEALVKAQEDLTEAITWATTKGGKGYSEAIDFINTLNVDDNVTTNNVNEAAYLFNCEPTAEKVKEAAEAFVFEAFDPTDPPTAEDFAGKGYNGEVVIEGATTLSDEKEGSNFGKPDWEENKQGAKFYRARLRK